jgi:hypothetical protein
MSITDLIERVEGATGPDRALDTAIERALFGDEPITEGWQGTLEYTASLDLALALCERVLPGWRVSVAHERNGEWSAFLITEDCDTAKAYAPSPALALILAMLRALQAKGAGE